MKYQSVCIAVSDIDKAREFYKELFDLEELGDYGLNVSFNCGISLQQKFEDIIDVSKDLVTMKPHNMELYFEEIDFDGFVRRLSEYPDISYLGDGVKEERWGQRTVRFYDLDGHIIEVGEDLKTVIERFLNSGLTMEETSKRMDVSMTDLEKLLKS